MIAIEIARPGGPEVLQPSERPIPEPGPGELRIRVKAAGIARADTLQRQGVYPPPPGASDIPGLDVAGMVDATGPAAEAWRVGDPVCAILAGGGYAEYCIASEQQALPIPENWSFEEAVTLPENLFTAYDNLITRAGLESGQSALIHGGTSGVGSLALMLCRAAGARAFTTVGSRDKGYAARLFGADTAINYNTEDFVAVIRQRTEGRGVDVVLDMVGGSYFTRNVECLATEGRLAIIASQGGGNADLDLRVLLRKRLRILGSTMRARTPAEKGAVGAALRRDIWPLLPGKNVIWPVVDSAFPLAQAPEAHRRMESGQHIGKIVLTV